MKTHIAMRSNGPQKQVLKSKEYRWRETMASMLWSLN